MSDINTLVDSLLTERRPDRYEVDGGDAWLDEIAAEVENLIPQSEASAIAARQIVRRREGQKTKDTNRLLREIKNTGQLPLDWFETMNWPLAVDKERVALRAATPQDFDAFAIGERRRAANDFASRNETCEAAEWIAGVMKTTGAKYGRDLSLDDNAA